MSTALTPIRVETGFWLILWAGLAAGIGIETDWGRQLQWPVAELAEAPPDVARPVLTEPFRLPEPDRHLTIATRPIFVVTRLPAPPAPVADSSRPSMKKDQFVLMGTTIVPEGKFAFLLEKAGNKSRVVAEGKEINGIMVKDVKADRVVLSQGGDTEVLVLKTIKPPPGSPAGAASATGATGATGAAGAPGVTPPSGRRPQAVPQSQAPAGSGANGQARRQLQPAGSAQR